jgi:hypothetical protein
MIEATPAHVKEEMDNPKAPTPDMMFGTACHTALLEPHLLASTVSVSDQCSAITGKGERCTQTGKYRSPDGQWFCGTKGHNRGLYPEPSGVRLSSEDFARCQLVAQSVMRHPQAKALIEAAAGEIENSIFWTDPASGANCKMRSDMWAAQFGVIVDFKTAASASPKSFQYSIKDYGYARQAAMNLRGANAAGLDATTFAFICAEKNPPFAVAIYEINAISLAIAEREINEALPRYAECERTGIWPGYSDRIEMISLPEWEVRRGVEKYGITI